MAYRSKIGPSKAIVGSSLAGNTEQQYGDSKLTLDGSGNGQFDINLGPVYVVGFRLILGTASNVPLVIKNMGRTILTITKTDNSFTTTSELLTNADGTTTNKFYSTGAFVNGPVTLQVVAGTAGGTLQIELFYSDN